MDLPSKIMGLPSEIPVVRVWDVDGFADYINGLPRWGPVFSRRQNQVGPMWVAHMLAHYGPNWAPHAIVHWVQNTIIWLFSGLNLRKNLDIHKSTLVKIQLSLVTEN